MNEPEVIRAMLGAPGPGCAKGSPHSARTLAVVGLSDNPAKASYSVSAYMQTQGYRILPVNPTVARSGIRVLGEPVWSSLADLPVKPDVVNVFRLPKFIPAIVEEMIALGFRDLWVQLGIVNLEAAAGAQAAGLRVVMDRCILIEHRNLAA